MIYLDLFMNKQYDLLIEKLTAELQKMTDSCEDEND